MTEEVSLRSLRDRPFELLAELERRGRAVSAQVAQEGAGGREWVGVALRMAGDLYLVAREETREVFGVPAGMTRVPGAKAWIKGLANVRGQLLPIIDLRQFLGSGTTPITRSRPGCWSMRCSASGALRKGSSPGMRPRLSRAASGISPAPSGARASSGRC